MDMSHPLIVLYVMMIHNLDEVDIDITIMIMIMMMRMMMIIDLRNYYRYNLLDIEMINEILHILIRNNILMLMLKMMMMD